jgi:pimeloyl-ACP methyl ester carboxylesterase
MKTSTYPALLLSLFVLCACSKARFFVPEGYVNEAFFVRNGKADLYTKARGNPETSSIIIHIHGGPAVGAQLLAQTRPVVYEAIEQAGIVIYYDQRGIGLSTGHFSDNSISLAQYTDDLHSVIEVCRYRYGSDKSIFLLSRSWGGLLAAEYLIREERPFEIAGWINVAGAYDLPAIFTHGKKHLLEVASEQIGKQHAVEQWNELTERASRYDTTDCSWDNLSHLWELGVEGMELLKEAEELKEAAPTTGLSAEDVADNTGYSFFEVAQNDWQGIPKKIMQPLLKYAPELEKIRVPTLFIYGYYDLLVPPDLANVGYSRIATTDEDKYLRIYPEQAHYPMGNVEQFTSDFETFVQSYE